MKKRTFIALFAIHLCLFDQCHDNVIQVYNVSTTLSMSISVSLFLWISSSLFPSFFLARSVPFGRFLVNSLVLFIYLLVSSSLVRYFPSDQYCIFVQVQQLWRWMACFSAPRQQIYIYEAAPSASRTNHPDLWRSYLYRLCGSSRKVFRRHYLTCLCCLLTFP